MRGDPCHIALCDSDGVLPQGYGRTVPPSSPAGQLNDTSSLVNSSVAAHRWTPGRNEMLAILSAIAFGTKPDFDGIRLEGIQRVSLDDITHAADMGFRIKLLGVAQLTGDEGPAYLTEPRRIGRIRECVHPVLRQHLVEVHARTVG